MSDLEWQTRTQIARALAGEMDLAGLDRWLAAAAWEAENQGGSGEGALARQAQLVLDEFQHGDWSDEELNSQLRGMVGVIGEYDPFATVSGSTSSTMKVGLSFTEPSITLSLTGAGTRVETVSA